MRWTYLLLCVVTLIIGSIFIIADTINWPITEFSVMIFFVMAYIVYSLIKSYKYGDRREEDTRLVLGNATIVNLKLLFAAIYLLSIILLKTSLYNRPVLYFVLFSLMFVLVAFEIIFVKNTRHEILLIQIFVLALNIIMSLYMVFPGFQGIDPWEHNFYVGTLVNDGHIFNMTYNEWPVFHILIATFSFLTKITNPVLNFFIPVGIPLAVGTILMFYMARPLVGEKNALLAALILTIGGKYIAFSVELIPQSLGIFLFLFVLYFIFTKNNFQSTLFLILTGLLLITTHSISALALVILIALFWFGKKIYNLTIERCRDSVSVVLFLLFGTALVCHWVYISTSVFDNGILSIVNHVLSKTGTSYVYGSAAGINLVESMLNGFGLWFLVLFFGVGTIESSKKRFENPGIFSLVTTAVAFYAFINGGAYITKVIDLQSSRLMAFFVLLIAPVCAMGITKFTGILNRLNWLIIPFLAIASFLMVTSLNMTTADPLFVKDNCFVPDYTRYSELSAATITTEINKKSIVYTGTGFLNTYIHNKGYQTDNYFSNPFIEHNSFIVLTKNFEDSAYKLNVKREYGILKESYTCTKNEKPLLEEIGRRYDKVFDNGWVNVFYT